VIVEAQGGWVHARMSPADARDLARFIEENIGPGDSALEEAQELRAAAYKVDGRENPCPEGDEDDRASDGAASA
jgi:hypothetical protein